MALPLRTRLLRELMWLGGIAIPLLALLGWFGVLHVLHQQADRRMADDLRLLDARITERLSRIEDASAALRLLWTSGLIDPSRPDQARLFLATQLGPAPGPASIMLVRAEDGVSFFAWARDQRRVSAAIRPIDGRRSVFLWSRDDRAGRPSRPLESEILPHAPLRSPWIAAAESRSGPGWTEPYPFAAFPEVARDRGIGMTYASAVRGQGGEILGYLGIDVSLDDLSDLAAAMRPTPSSDVMILDGRNRVLASSTRVPAQSYLQPVDSGAFPLVQAVLVQGGGVDSGARRVQFRNRTWFGRAAALPAMAAQGWRITVAIPESELIGSARLELVALFVALAGLMLAVALRLGLLSRRLSASLGDLAAAAHELGTAKELALPPEGSMAEVNELRSALQRSHRALLEQQRLSDQLTHSQRVALVGFLAGGLAHDINNQLGAVLAGLAEGRTRLDGGSPAAEPLEQAERACWRAAEAMRGLFALSRKGAPSFRAVDVNAVVRETGLLLERLFERRVQLELEPASDLPLISADPIQLEQVLLNLAINARDAMPTGGVLRLRTRALADGVRIEVTDTGAGMSEEVRARIFEPFFTTKRDGKGTGLGLAMVASIVRSHGGSVQVESEPGRGTLFRLDLPFEPPAGPPAH